MVSLGKNSRQNDEKTACLLQANSKNRKRVSWHQLMFHIKWWVFVVIKTSCFHMYDTFECHFKPNQKLQSDMTDPVEGQSSPSCWTYVWSYLQIYVQLCTNIDSKSQIVLNQGSVNQVALNSSKYSQIKFKFPKVNRKVCRTHLLLLALPLLPFLVIKVK